MPVATSYPVLGAFWTLLMFFGFVIWIWLLFTVFADVFRRRDIGGWGKAAWILFVIILPYLGVIVYLIAEHNGMAERSEKDQKAAQAQFDAYVQKSAGTTNPADQIAQAKALLDAGTISQGEFDSIKTKALA
jgi:hypothetical protein